MLYHAFNIYFFVVQYAVKNIVYRAFSKMMYVLLADNMCVIII